MKTYNKQNILLGFAAMFCFLTAGIITAGETTDEIVVINPYTTQTASTSQTSVIGVYVKPCTAAFGESVASSFIHFPKRADTITPTSAKIYGCFVNSTTTQTVAKFADYKFQLSKDNLFGDDRTFTQVLNKSLLKDGQIEIPVSGLDEKSTYFYRFCLNSYGCTSRQAFVTAFYDPYAPENIIKNKDVKEDLSRFSHGDKRYYFNGEFLGTDYNTFLMYERAYKEGRYVNGKIIPETVPVVTSLSSNSVADKKSYEEMRDVTRKIFDKNYVSDEEDYTPVKKQIVYVYNIKPKKVIQNYESGIVYAQNTIASPIVKTHNSINTQTVNGVTYENSSYNSPVRDITFELIKDESLNKNKSYQNIHITANSNNSFFPTTTEGWLIVIILIIGILLAFRAGLESRATKM